MKSLIHFFSCTNWKLVVELSKLIHKKIEIKKVKTDVINDTLNDVLIINSSDPLVKIKKKTPIKGKNIKIDNIGKFILN